MDFNALHLIRLVREMPQIYDASLADFKIPEKKEQAWLKVAGKLNTSADECRKRWRTMRERYTRELKRFKSTDSGIKQECPPDAATANISWSLFDDMSFLYDHVKLRKTRYTFEKSIKSQPSESDPIMMDSDQLVDQNTSEEATTAGQVYAKFKVQSVDGSDGCESRILVNEDYKDYSQLQVVEHISTGREEEHHEVVVADDGDEEEADDEEEEEEFLTDDNTHHHQPAASSGHRIILTAPRDNTPSPLPMPPPPLVHHHHTTSSGVETRKRKHNGSNSSQAATSGGGNGGTTTTTMTIEPADHIHHPEIVSLHQHHSSLANSHGATMIHHVSPMQAQTLIGTASPMQQQQLQQDENDFFGSAVSGSLRQLSRVYNIKAKVEIFKVLEKFIELDDRK